MRFAVKGVRYRLGRLPIGGVPDRKGLRRIAYGLVFTKAKAQPQGTWTERTEQEESCVLVRGWFR